MRLDGRYLVLATLEAREGVTLYRVEGGWVVHFEVHTPEDKDRFFRYRQALRRLEELGLLEVQVSAKPGRYYAFFPERPLARKPPPKEALEALAPLGFGEAHLAMGEDKVAYLAPWPLGGKAWAREGRGRFWVQVAPGLGLAFWGLVLLALALGRYLNPPEYPVPDLVGRTAREAFAILKDTELNVQVLEGNDPQKPKEVVLAQDPPPGTRLRAGRTVFLTLNQARLTPLPNLGGLSLEEAEARLRELGLVLGREVRTEAEAPLGTVLATAPPPGTPVPPGTRVDLLLSQGPSPRGLWPLPNLVGLSREEALFLLNAAGLVPEVVEVPSGEVPDTVLAQNPKPGTPLPPGAGVTLRVAVRGEVWLPPPSSVTLDYTLPPEAQDRSVRLVLVDQEGERVVYEGLGQEGMRLEGSYPVQGEALFRLYVDGALFAEWRP